jgi:hypothetical protein
MITQLNSELKKIALDILDFPLDMRDTTFPFWHAVPLHKKHPKLDDYKCTYPKWYNHENEFLEILRHKIDNTLPSAVIALEVKDKFPVQIPNKGIVQIFSLNKKHTSIVIGKDLNNLMHCLDIPSYEQFDWAKHYISNNALHSDNGLYVGNKFFHSIHASAGAKLLYVKYN